jgi:uncharacterized protein YbjT (DUF2867 family)
MKIVVSGGTGLIGRRLVQRLREKGHEVAAASLDPGVGAVTDEDLADVLAGAQVVVDMIFPSFEDPAALERSKKLIAAEVVAGTRHHLAMWIVGTDRTREGRYLRAKAAQGNLIKAAGIPYTILCSTQFFEFVDSIITSGVDGDMILRSSARGQPIASDDGAAALAELAVGSPLNATVDVACPEAWPGGDSIRRKLPAARQDARQAIADIHARYVARTIDQRWLIQPLPRQH